MFSIENIDLAGLRIRVYIQRLNRQSILDNGSDTPWFLIHESSVWNIDIIWIDKFYRDSTCTRMDSATLESTQWIINAANNQCSLQSTPLYPDWFNHQLWGHVWRSRTSAGVRCAHFFYCNHNIRGSGLKWNKPLALIVWCVDYPLHCTYRCRAPAWAV
jgi:hypothetical protein